MEEVNHELFFFVAFTFMVCQFNRIFSSRALSSVALCIWQEENLKNKQLHERGKCTQCWKMANLRITLTVYFTTKMMALSFHNALEAHYYNRENCADCARSECMCEIRKCHQMDYVKLWTVRAPWAQSQSSELNFARRFPHRMAWTWKKTKKKQQRTKFENYYHASPPSSSSSPFLACE